MKKSILSLIFLAFTICVSAQSTSPRFSTSPLGDNTGRVLTYGTRTAVVTTTMITLQPAFYETLYTVPTTSLSPTFTVNLTSSFYGDKMKVFIASNATGTRTISLSTNIIGAAATQTLAASKKGYFDFIFDGAKWIQGVWTPEP